MERESYSIPVEECVICAQNLQVYRTQEGRADRMKCILSSPGLVRFITLSCLATVHACSTVYERDGEVVQLHGWNVIVPRLYVSICIRWTKSLSTETVS